MTRTERALVSVVVAGIAAGLGATAYAGREGSGSHHREGSGTHHHGHKAPFRDGESVELSGRITGSWLTVTEGPYAGKRFALVENAVFEDLRKAGPATAAYRITGTALEDHGTNRILINSFQRGSGSASAPAPSYREGS